MEDAARAHREAFGDVGPANTMLHVAGLVGEGLLVEVELDAELGMPREDQRAAEQRPDVADFVALAVAAEEAGFDQVWLSHDLFWRSAPVVLAAAAVATDRISLGVGIVNPYSAHPAEIAMHAATLQELSHGRFLLGLGAGADEFLGWAGIPRPQPLARTRRGGARLRALLPGRPGRRPALASSAGSPRRTCGCPDRRCPSTSV